MVKLLGRKLAAMGDGKVRFDCPACDAPHAVRVEGEGRPRWTWNGDGDRPTFQPSVFVNPPGQFHNPAVPSCHSFVTDGSIQFLSDCTHALAGQTVELPDIDGD